MKYLKNRADALTRDQNPFGMLDFHAKINRGGHLE